MKLFRLMTFGLAAILAAQPASAQVSQSFQDWEFRIGTMDNIADTSCIASTRTARTGFFLVVTPSRESKPDAHIIFENSQWDIPRQRLDYRIRFDQNTWRMQGRGRGPAVVTGWSDLENFLDFMEDVASNQGMVLMTQDEDQLAAFSLAGSRDATIAIEDCVGQLNGVPLSSNASRNPFDAGTNPF